MLSSHLHEGRYAQAALDAGLYVYKPGGARVPIPVALEPTIVDLDPYNADARLLLRAAAKACARLPLSALGKLTELEQRFLSHRRASQDPLRLVTARVDYMGGHALELNATIPAMQGYGDMVTQAYLQGLGLAPATVDELMAENGSNTAGLAAALRAARPLPEGPRRVAIVARPEDSQRGELLYYVERFRALGLPAQLCTPDELHLQDDGTLFLGGEPVGLIYRHIFSWRLTPHSDFARAFDEAPRHHIFNPVAIDLEAKATLAELSRAAEAPADAEPWLTADERAAIRRRVPWTRVLDGTTAGLLEADRERYVLKRSWDYGGRAVHLGIDIAPDAWLRLLGEALDPGDVWVAQERVALEAEPRTLLGPGGAQRGAVYADLCCYASLGFGEEVQPRGGVSRVAPRRIVNILGGGGLAPVLRPEVQERIARSM